MPCLLTSYKHWYSLQLDITRISESKILPITISISVHTWMTSQSLLVTHDHICTSCRRSIQSRILHPKQYLGNDFWCLTDDKRIIRYSMYLKEALHCMEQTFSLVKTYWSPTEAEDPPRMTNLLYLGQRSCMLTKCYWVLYSGQLPKTTQIYVLPTLPC